MNIKPCENESAYDINNAWWYSTTHSNMPLSHGQPQPGFEPTYNDSETASAKCACEHIKTFSLATWKRDNSAQGTQACTMYVLWHYTPQHKHTTDSLSSNQLLHITVVDHDLGWTVSFVCKCQHSLCEVTRTNAPAHLTLQTVHSLSWWPCRSHTKGTSWTGYSNKAQLAQKNDKVDVVPLCNLHVTTTVRSNFCLWCSSCTLCNLHWWCFPGSN